MRKAIKYGEDFVRDEQWNPIVRNRKGVEALGRKLMPADLKVQGFKVAVFESDEYFRICFGRKV